MDHMFHDGHFGRWWNDPQLAQQIGLTDQQKQQMDQIFLQHRLKLIDLNANLEKQEVMFRPMIEADQPDETKILAQIDAIAQARADLEKADARMLFDLRKTLTPEQWTKLKAMRMQHRDRDRMRNDRRDSWGPGRHGPMGPNGGPPAGPPNGAPQGQAPAPPQ
jgi:Spy/CpxP family protein refolding chaperone